MTRFEDLGNGIIRDTRTGLEWQAEPFGPATWPKQMDAASKLNLGGHTDWRLPTIEELVTLIDFSRCNPASKFPGQRPEWFWSSSSRVAYTSYAWRVDFNVGYVDNDGKAYGGHARCVRAALAGKEAPE